MHWGRYERGAAASRRRPPTSPAATGTSGCGTWRWPRWCTWTGSPAPGTVSRSAPGGWDAARTRNPLIQLDTRLVGGLLGAAAGSERVDRGRRARGGRAVRPARNRSTCPSESAGALAPLRLRARRRGRRPRPDRRAGPGGRPARGCGCGPPSCSRRGWRRSSRPDARWRRRILVELFDRGLGNRADPVGARRARGLPRPGRRGTGRARDAAAAWDTVAAAWQALPRPYAGPAGARTGGRLPAPGRPTPGRAVAVG